MKKKFLGKRFLTAVLVAALSCSVNVMTFADGESVKETTEIPERAGDAGCKEIPNTKSSFSKYDPSFLSVSGYASLASVEATGAGVHDRSEYIGTSQYRQVQTAKELVQAIYDAQSGKVKVIEIMKDLDAGYTEANVSSEFKEIGKPTCLFLEDGLTKAGVKYTNPLLLEAGGISKIQIKNTDGLTIFSRYGATLNRTSFDIQASSNDIVIRNIKMDGSWHWDNNQNNMHKDSSVTYVKVNANNVWIDHCEFTMAPDGAVDLESKAHGVTLSWCKFGMDPDKAVDNETVNATIMYMEDLYQQDLVARKAGLQDDFRRTDINYGSRYRLMREAGATPEEIMQYTAFHSKVHLCGAGDHDIDKNPFIRISLGYNYYQSVAQRVPMIRQGTGHMYNCYLDDSKHAALENKFQNTYHLSGSVTSYTLSRAVNARNGASIAADTCVFNYMNGPMCGAELQGDDTGNMDGTWPKNFSNTYNHALIVNSKTTNTKGETYTGSSWDKNGENLFTRDFKWHDKSTIGKWAWSSTVTTKFEGETYAGVFDVEYGYDEKLPYEYKLVPLDDVESVVKTYSGMGVFDMTPEQWCQVVYSADCGIEPAGENKVNIASKIKFADEEPKVYVGDVVTLETITTPLNITDAVYSWKVKNSGAGAAKATIDESTGELTALGTGKVIVTVKCTSKNGTSVSASLTISILDAAERPVTTPTPTASGAATSTPTATASGAATATPTATGTSTAIPTPTGTATVSPTPTATGGGATESPTGTPSVTKLGDANLDGEVTLDDVTLVLKASLKLTPLEGQAKINADATKDGEITLEDVTLILKASLKLVELK